MNPYLLVVILGIVEGITEFLPVSSTGHMILVEKFINSPYVSKDFMDNFLIIVQLGAILSVVLYFWKDIHPFVKSKEIFKERVSLWSKIIVGVLPAAVLGLLFDDYITEFFLGNTKIVATTLIFYGVIFCFIEEKIKKVKVIDNIKNIPYSLAIIIGFFQCLAMIPGTSRSGATIIGSLLLGLSKGVAAEFSFFLAIPTMMGATLLKLVKNGVSFTPIEWQLLGIGFFISFIVAFIVIKWFMGYIKTRTFKLFGIYRIILGILVFLFLN
ncbi:MAG: undecaprenyl-diphosphate phosphatase [Fusobacterium perfoetens]|uniref:undecaprenyl-diphosphate phosphatase n=1 Tax=Fusobacterium perfoetens TaxID=852 RepID=UPI0023F143AF|nr:undecaprenyl-diphosphate phosphatase [Fusobacterium perfoetens]MCI6152136.1 undecaprenyl-diphosphate phosphatase [Fusobacterium perfoetens]MDY3237973.1 undecaprenyl-diphosphate phosphatase [Fusobacterium perfoetens]